MLINDQNNDLVLVNEMFVCYAIKKYDNVGLLVHESKSYRYRGYNVHIT